MIALVPLLVAAYTFAIQARIEILERAGDDLQDRLRRAAAAKGDLIAQVAATLDTLAGVPAIRQRDRTLCTGVLRNVRVANEFYAALMLTDWEGNLICTDREAFTTTDRRDRLDFQRVRQTGEFSVGEYTIGRESKVPVVHFGLPVFDDDRTPIGVISAAVLVSALNARLDAIALPPGYVVALADADGRIFARHPAAHVPPAVQGAAPPPSVEAPSLAGRVFDPTDWLAASSPLGGDPSDLRLWMAADRARVTAPADETLNRTFLAVILFTAFVAGATWLLAVYYLRHPARQFASVARAIGDGDLARRIGPPYSGGEIGDIGFDFDRLMDRLAEREAALAASEYRLRMAQHAGRIGVWDFDVASRTVICTDGLNLILGLPPATSRRPATALLELIHVDDRDRVVARGREALAAGTAFAVDFRVCRPDGRIRWLEMRAEALIGERHAVRRILGVTVDVTERVDAERKLEDSERRLQLALDCGRMGTWSWNVGEDRLSGDARQCDLINPGAGHAPLSSEAMLTHVHSEDALPLRQEVERLAARGEGEFDTEFRLIGQNAPIRWLAVHGRAMRDPATGAVSLAGVSFDITARKHAQERIELLAREVDHRTRNVLTIVSALVRMTHADTPKEFAAMLLGRIEALARANTLLAEGRWEATTLRRLIDEEFAPYVRGGATRVRISGPEIAIGPKPAQSLAMALHELATNAAKYGALSSPRGEVEIAWEEEGENVCLHWRETGGPPAPTPTRRGTGSAVVDAVVRVQLGGSVTVEWGDKGFACDVTLPRDAFAASPEEGTFSTPPPADSRDAHSAP